MDINASDTFSQAFDFASGATGDRFQNPFWKFKELLFGARLRKSISEVKKFGDSIVSSAVKKRAEDCLQRKGPSGSPHETHGPLQNNLISSLLDHISDHGVVADAAMNYLSAGRDTTAQSLTWTLYLLLRNPHTLPPLLSELQAAFPASQTNLPLIYDVISSQMLPYTYATFYESLRLHPLVPIELKESTAPTTFPDGTSIPKGAVVLWAPWAMNRSFEIWGCDADDFKPHRWLAPSHRSVPTSNGNKEHSQSEHTSLLNKSAFEFPVFNAGPRSCLGKKMAELLVVRVLADLLWKYEFSGTRQPGSSGENVTIGEKKSRNSLTLPMEGQLKCLIRRRVPEADM